MSSYGSSALRGGAFALCLAVMSCGGGNSIGGGMGGGGTGGGGTGGGGMGGGGTVTGANVASVTVGAGPAGVNALNTLYTSVTVCVPGSTTECQTIDNIQVDTGSYGLRLLSQVVTLTLPVAPAASGGGLVECTEFVDGYSWGPVVLVDLQIAGESARSVPVQLIGDSRYPTVPSNCQSGGPTSEDTVTTFGANGILGIGPFAQDCGPSCAASIPGPIIQYYSCSTPTVCQGSIVPINAQVQNPVTMFATDNNGSIISLPPVAATGAANVTGYLIFGIDTESNNMSGTETVVPVSTGSGYVTTVFQTRMLADSFIDSGSNATYFDDSSLTQCPSSPGSNPTLGAFYCPAGPVSVTAALVLANNSTVNETTVVASANSVGNSVTAYPGLAGTNPDASSFDWGLPFFYGRRVANAIEGASTSVGTGPYIAF